MSSLPGATLGLLLAWGTAGRPGSRELPAGDDLATADRGYGRRGAAGRPGDRTPGRARHGAVRARRAAGRRLALSRLRTGDGRRGCVRRGQTVGGGAGARGADRAARRGAGGLEPAMDSGGQRAGRSSGMPRGSPPGRPAPSHGCSTEASRATCCGAFGLTAASLAPGRRRGGATFRCCRACRSSPRWRSAPDSPRRTGGAIRSAGRGARMRWLAAGIGTGLLLAMLR